VIAASLLTALGACLALLAQPSAASSLDSYDIRASIRYGCAQDSGDDNFVEVTLSAENWNGDDHELLLQVGLAGPESPDSAGVFPEGGPSLVTLGENPEKVRLAGPVHDGDHVFLRQVDSPQTINLPLQPTCNQMKPTNFGLAEPAVEVATKSCTSGSQANLRVTLDNPNDVDQKLQKIGIDQIEYTVLLVRQDGRLAGTDPVGTLMSFNEPSSAAITVSQVVDEPARYEIRVIALDGAVVTSDSLRLSCAGPPVPSSTSRPSPSVSVTLPPSSSQPPSTPAPTPTATVTQPPTSSAPSSSAASSSVASRSPTPTSSAPASSAPASSTPPGTSQPTSPANSSPAGSAGGPTASSSPSRSSAPAPGPSNSGVQPPNTTLPSRPSSSAASSTSAPSPEPSIIRLVEPRADYGGLPVFQKDVALVVLLFSAALTVLVGSAVVNARRR
jgi:hypothetical protein